jgi:hypothetical protein
MFEFVGVALWRLSVALAAPTQNPNPFKLIEARRQRGF